MKKKFICFLISETPFSIETLVETITSVPIDDLKNIARLLEEEYGITVCQKEKAEKDLQKLFEQVVLNQSHGQTIVFKDVPTFPIPPELISKQKNKHCFAPPNKGKINSKPKGKFRK